MTSAEIAPAHRLDVYQDNRGEWRWRLQGPSREILVQSGLAGFATREEALTDANAVLDEAGLDAWATRLDGITTHALEMRIPRVDAVREARDAGLRPADPEATEKAREALAKLEEKRLAAESNVQKQREATPAEGIVDEPKNVTQPRARASKPAEDPNPLADQMKRSSKAKSE